MSTALDVAIAGTTPNLLMIGILALVGIAGTLVVLTRDPGRQVAVLAGYGLLLGVLMLTLRMPAVAATQLVVGVVVVPLLATLTIHRVEGRGRRPRGRQSGD